MKVQLDPLSQYSDDSMKDSAEKALSVVEGLDPLSYKAFLNAHETAPKGLKKNSITIFNPSFNNIKHHEDSVPIPDHILEDHSQLLQKLRQYALETSLLSRKFLENSPLKHSLNKLVSQKMSAISSMPGLKREAMAKLADNGLVSGHTAGSMYKLDLPIITSLYSRLLKDPNTGEHIKNALEAVASHLISKDVENLPAHGTIDHVINNSRRVHESPEYMSEMLNAFKLLAGV